MPTLRTKMRLWLSEHSRLMSGLQFAVLVLIISGASGLAAASLIRIFYVEQLVELKAQYASELTRLQSISAERLAEKDAIIREKDIRLDALAERLGIIMKHKTP